MGRKKQRGASDLIYEMECVDGVFVPTGKVSQEQEVLVVPEGQRSVSPVEGVPQPLQDLLTGIMVPFMVADRIGKILRRL